MAKFIIEQVLTATGDPDDDFFNVAFMIIDGTDLISEQYVTWAVANYSSEDEFRDAMVGAIVGWANANGYSGTTVDDVINYKQAKRLVSHPTRALNTVYQPSAYRDTEVSVSVEQSTTLSLSGGQTANMFLEYADDSGFTTNVKEIGRSTNGNTGTLTIGLNITQVNTGTVTGTVPAGKHYRIRTTGTGTQTLRSVQEVIK